MHRNLLAAGVGALASGAGALAVASKLKPPFPVDGAELLFPLCCARCCNASKASAASQVSRSETRMSTSGWMIMTRHLWRCSIYDEFITKTVETVVFTATVVGVDSEKCDGKSVQK